MNVLIVEDDKLQAAGIITMLEKNFKAIQLYTAYDYDTATHLIDSKHIDLFLLDIELKSSKNGIDIGKYIRANKELATTPILYLTALEGSIYEALHDTNCFDYILKPYTETTLIEAIDKLLKADMIKQYIKFKGNDGVFFKLLPDDIIYVQSDRRNMVIHTAERIYNISNLSFSNLFSILPDYILQCHKSYAVNVNYISHFDKVTSMLYLKQANESIPIGKKYISLFEKEFENV